jgi:glycosyltransferase involved in cell wall biosynthesis
MKNVKILYIGNNLFRKTGYPTTLQTLSQLLSNEGYVVKQTSGKLNKLARMLDMIFSIFKYQNRVDFVLIDTYSTLNFYYAYISSILLKAFNKPYIPILHGGNLPERLKKSPKLSKGIFSNAYINVAPSEYLSIAFEKEGYKTTCIPNTLNINMYKFKARKVLEPKLLYVRSFADIYNPQMAIKTLFELKKEYPNATLCMIGPDRDGTLKQVQELVEALNLEINVEFTGVLTKSEWHKKATDYDIFINTSNVDNMPVSLIEAMALGLPVVSTNVGGIKYLIRNNINGTLVKPNDVKAMTNAIVDLIKNGAGDTPINTRKYVEGFQWDVVKHKWNKLLTKA